MYSLGFSLSASPFLRASSCSACVVASRLTPVLLRGFGRYLFRAAWVNTLMRIISMTSEGLQSISSQPSLSCELPLLCLHCALQVDVYLVAQLWYIHIQSCTSKSTRRGHVKIHPHPSCHTDRSGKMRDMRKRSSMCLSCQTGKHRRGCTACSAHASGSRLLSNIRKW